MESGVTDIRRDRPNAPNDFASKDDNGGDKGMFSRDIPGTRTRVERGKGWVECDREASSKRAVSELGELYPDCYSSMDKIIVPLK